MCEICQLIASLSVILFQLNMIKLKLYFLKSDFWCKKEDKKTNQNFSSSLKFDLFQVHVHLMFDQITAENFTLKI